MCGIAGIIHRDGPGDIGAEMARMLQSMKHRGPDSSGFALYGPPSDLLVMRIKLADPNETRGFGWSERLERHRNEVEHRLAKIGAMVDVMHGDQEYAYRVTFRYSGELQPLADYMEDVPGCEVLSLGHSWSMNKIKDLNDAESVAERYQLNGFTGTHAIGHVRMADLSPTWTSPVPYRYWAYPFLRHRRGAQRPAHQLPHVAAQAGATGAPVPVRVRLEDHRGLPGAEDGRRALLETAMKQSLDELDGVFTYLVVTEDSLRGQGRDGGQAAGLVRVPGTGRARLRGGRHPRRDRPRDRHL